MSAWRAAVTTFTVIPAGGEKTISPDTAARIALWLPGVGCLLAVPSAGIVLGVDAGGASPARRLLGATLAVAALAVMTGGLHLDGLADTADGLASRRPGPEALEIMRRSDTGPMGVAAIVITLLVQVTALASVRASWLGAAALIAAVVTGRVAALLATGSPSARSSGFGALIAGTTSRPARWAAAVLLLGIAGLAAAAAGGPGLAGRALAAIAGGLVVAFALRQIACRRLGGMTGDVFGAMIELSGAAVLLVAALSG